MVVIVVYLFMALQQATRVGQFELLEKSAHGLDCSSGWIVLFCFWMVGNAANHLSLSLLFSKVPANVTAPFGLHCLSGQLIWLVVDWA